MARKRLLAEQAAERYGSELDGDLIDWSSTSGEASAPRRSCSPSSPRRASGRTAISFDPAKQADTIRKQGGFIPGIRPGPQTERYLARILSRITFPGAMFIAAVALVPSILIAVTIGTDSASGAGAGAGGFAFGGISLLIATGVALETMKQIDSQLMMRNYEGFLK